MKGMKFLSVFIALAMILGTATLAFAAKPVFYSWDYGQTDTIDCGAFDIQDAWTSHATARDYLDKQGNWVRTGVWFTYIDQWTGPDGKAVTADHGERVYVEVTADGESVHGIDYNVVVPGVGQLLINAGYLHLDYASGEITQHGNHQVVNGAFDELCAYLAPD